MRITIEIQLGNDTMRTGDDVARALEQLARQTRVHNDLSESWAKGLRFPVLDQNGNKVGGAVVESDVRANAGVEARVAKHLDVYDEMERVMAMTGGPLQDASQRDALEQAIMVAFGTSIREGTI